MDTSVKGKNFATGSNIFPFKRRIHEIQVKILLRISSPGLGVFLFTLEVLYNIMILVLSDANISFILQILEAICNVLSHLNIALFGHVHFCFANSDSALVYWTSSLIHTCLSPQSQHLTNYGLNRAVVF